MADKETDTLFAGAISYTSNTFWDGWSVHASLEGGRERRASNSNS